MTLFWSIAAGSLALSWGAKLLAERLLPSLLAYNKGVAFSLSIGGAWQFPLILLALAFVVYLAFTSERTPLHQTGFGLIVGGALGNVLDRVRDGLVTDFIHVGTFPVFNIADSCITAGVILLLFSMAREMLAKRRK